MSVLHLLGTAGDGGAETYFLDLIAALGRAGVRQAAAIRGHDAREAALAAADVPVKTARFGKPFDPFTRLAVAQFAQQQDAEIAVAWMNRAARHTPRGRWARIGRLGGYYKLKYYRGFDHLVANTEDIAEWAVGQGWPARRISYIPNFAAPPPAVQAVDRAGLQTPAGAPLLLAMGRLHQAKAHDVALQALTQIPDAYLWIAGSGPLEAKLRALAAALGVEARVRFLGWRTDASALYRAADICLFPSRYEPLGNVVIQAWAHDLPVVAAASQGPSGLIHDGVDGLLAPIDDAQALAGAVSTLIADPALGVRLAEAGRRRVTDNFSEAAVVAQWRELFAAHGAR